ncbi:MAG TPA: hypothetical protein VN823_17700 [Stellaceae bacterium]|nr:hypothetical protein [Stellaceae bacterium]
MYDDDTAIRRAFETELQAVTEETARLRRDLDAIESDLTAVVEMVLQYTGRGDLALDFLECLGNPRGTLH